MAADRSQSAITHTLRQLVINIGRIGWQFVVAPVQSLRNILAIIVPFACQTLVIGVGILLTLRRHEPKHAKRTRAEPWDNAANARFVWNHARDYWIIWILKRIKMRVQTIGLERVDWAKGPYVLVSNHQSVMDIALIVATLPQSARFVAKKQLLRWPIVGWVIGLTQIIIDRDKGPEARKAILDAARNAPDLSIIVFAEGTRTADGSLGTFKTGAAELAIEMSAPIVPIAIDGTRAAMPKGFASLISLRSETQGYITYGEPVSLAEMFALDKKALTELVRSKIAGMLQSEAK